MRRLVTTLGPIGREQVGMILPHEHVFTDLRNEREAGYAEARADDVIRVMVPELERAKRAGVSVIVECTPIGVGRRADLLKAVSEAAGFPLVVPTGAYREPWMPEWVMSAGVDELSSWMRGELDGEIGTSGVRAGWIKLSAGDDGMTANERKLLQAAAEIAASSRTLIGSHTIRGRVVREQLDLLSRAGCGADRFVWIHAQVEPDFDRNLEMAERGAWIEYDSIGSPEQDRLCLDRILRMVAHGFGDRILISQDRGWYDPAKPGGGTPQPYTHLVGTFVPMLRRAGLPEERIRQLTVENPFEAFAR